MLQNYYLEILRSRGIRTIAGDLDNLAKQLEILASYEKRAQDYRLQEAVPAFIIPNQGVVK